MYLATFHLKLEKNLKFQFNLITLSLNNKKKIKLKFFPYLIVLTLFLNCLIEIIIDSTIKNTFL